MRGARTYRELQERRMLEIDAKLAENTSITEDVRDLLRGLKVFGRIAKWTGALAAAYIALREVLRLHGWWGK
jgi:hypothetical protein